MEIATSSSRKKYIGDGAKDKLIAAIYDDPWNSPRKGMNIVCSDGISIDAELFEMESIVVSYCYEHDITIIEVESNSKIIKKVEHFCVTRAMIENYYAVDKDYRLQQNKLNAFSSNFRQQNQIYALDIMIAAFDLEISSLVDLMMEDVDDMFTKMTNDNEVFDILFVNLYDEYSLDKYELMQDELKGYKWVFEGLLWDGANDEQISAIHDDSEKPYQNNIHRKANNWDWDAELLKVPFHEYKTLPYERQ
ncbi:uncharacterized protein [Rutidosis leptorrhynchoides]|uniref:uncharacterized protein n=1 Tax=Rutidosis leptorrhynchoides TaxID=125765 RepID=UPI003A9A62B4